MRRNAAKIIAGGQPVTWLGANFWSRTGGPLMWRNYDPAVVSSELRVLRDHGLTMTRSFFYWPDFMPAPDVIDQDMAARFADFLDRHTEHDMTTVPTFIVGPDIEAKRLALVLPQMPPTELGIYALYAPNRYLAAKTRVFIDFLIERFGEKPAWDAFGR